MAGNQVGRANGWSVSCRCYRKWLSCAQHCKDTTDYSAQSVSRVAFAREGLLVALAGSTDGPGAGAGGQPFLALWDADAGRELRRLEGASSFGALTFSPDGRLLAVFDREQVRLLEVPTGRE